MSVYFTFWLWFGISVFLSILEIFCSTSFFLLWLGIAAFFTGSLVWIFPQISWEIQIVLFSISAIFSIVLWNRYLNNNKDRLIKTDKPTLNRRAEQYIGRTFTLSEPIVNGRGKIQVDDSTWRVEGPDLPVGTTVMVMGVDSVTLKIQPSVLVSPFTGH